MNHVHQLGVRVIQAKVTRHALKVGFRGIQAGDAANITAQFLTGVTSRVGAEAVSNQVHIIRIQAVVRLRISSGINT